MTKFTKGPWQVSGNEVEFDHRYQECCGQGNVNGCCGEPVVAGEAGSICECNDPANAALIAAAPELYEALQLCAIVLSGDALNKSSLISALEATRSALAKAEGRTP